MRGKASLRAQLLLPFGTEEREPRSFWQARFYDFNVYTEGKIKEKLNYMHANPVIRRLVKHPKDWPWSSWSFYMRGEAGLLAMDRLEEGRAVVRPEQKGREREDPPLNPKGGAPSALLSPQ